MVVTVEDSNKGLNYVAAGVGRYNNKEVVGSPAILSGCTAQYRYRNPFSAGALTAPEAQCWGELYSRVDTAGYFVDEKTNSAICNRWTQPIKTMGAGACVEIKFTARSSESPRRPPRHRCAACSMAWRCHFLAARASQDGRVIAEK